MKVIVPASLTFTSSTADSSSYDEWDVGTSYTQGDLVKVTTSEPYHEYEALQATTGDAPASSPTYWLDLGVSNEYKLLDDKTTSQTQQLNGFATVVNCPTRASHLAVFTATYCESVRIQQEVDSVEVLDETYPMRAFSPAGSWSDYYFAPSEYKDSLIVEIPGWYQDSDFTITFSTSTGLTVGIGHLVIGQYYEIGTTIQPLKHGILDYSVKSTDDFGDTILTERVFTNSIKGSASIEDARIDTVQRIMSQRRATGSVWDVNDDGSDLDSYRLFGFCREFEFEFDEDTVMTFELEGLT